jgi:hypothetical protein
VAVSLLGICQLACGPAAPDKPTVSAQDSAVKRAQPMFIGVDANPPANEPYTPDAVRKSAQKAVDAGKTYMHLAPKWNDLEPEPGRYNFEELDFDVSLSEQHGLPIELGVRIIDTNQRSMPEAYKNWALDDPRMAEKLNALLQALGPRLKGLAKWVTIGNEVDAYFGAHEEEIGPYVTLMKRALPTVHEQFEGALFTINFTFDAHERLQSDYAPFLSLVDFLSLTYYPLLPDFTVKDTGQVGSDLETAIEAAGNRRILFQEIGCPSAERLNSSEEKQAAVLQQVFRVLKKSEDRVIAANILWMSDIPDSLVEQFGQYYQLPGSENFKAFLATLGLFDKTGRAKAAWSVFEREATSIREGRSQAHLHPRTRPRR